MTFHTPTYPPTIPPTPPLTVKPPPPDFQDPASHSFPGVHFTDHIHLTFTIDFTTKLLKCKADYTIRVIDPMARHLTLDIRGITISSITAGDHKLPYTIEKPDWPIGPALRITLPDLSLPDSAFPPPFRFSIEYTTPGNGDGHNAGGALDWLSPEQTDSNAPFAFTQCQAIHARSIVPCQDTPAVKSTYSAVVSVIAPDEELTPVMSAQRVDSHPEDPEGSVRFECGVPIPSYLIAFAVGKIEFRELSPRCCVWAQPQVIKDAEWEFAEVEKMLQTAEKIAGDYVWGRYDLLVLPGSFPYGGMENPFLTFVTPTLIAYDRSLANVVVHEIAHAWSGNLVSCQDCRHFWLNEGFTVKLERRILRELDGTGREGIDGTAGRRDLDDFIQSVGEDHKYTCLVSKLGVGEDPDDYFSIVPYEKGYNFLLLLEQAVEREYPGQIFHEFLREYFYNNRYQSITTVDFIDIFKNKFPKVYEQVDFNEWLYATGPCPELAPLDRHLVDEAVALAEQWLELFKKVQGLSYDEAVELIRYELGSKVEDFKTWHSKQKHCFLTEMRPRTAEEGVVWNDKCAGYLDEVHEFNEMLNAEIRFMWCRLAISASYETVLANVEEFVGMQGRMKYIRPLYNDLNDIYPKGEYAKELFAKNESSYHSIAVKMIKRDLGLDG